MSFNVSNSEEPVDFAADFVFDFLPLVLILPVDNGAIALPPNSLVVIEELETVDKDSSTDSGNA